MAHGLGVVVVLGGSAVSALVRRPRRPGAGSWRVLGWVARLGIAGVEPAQRALRLSQAVVYSHLGRLAEDGIVTRLVVGDGRGGVVALTRRGARIARERGLPGVLTPWSSSPASGRHGRAVSWVAAAAELRGWEWRGPAELRAEAGWMPARGDGRRHAPDLGIVRASGRTAIEVELHAKSRDRLRAILAGYRELIDHGDLTAVSYVTDRRNVSELVRREAAAAMLGRDLHVGPLDRIVADVRSRAVNGRGERGQ